jgi:hypothetical protein
MRRFYAVSDQLLAVSDNRQLIEGLVPLPPAPRRSSLVQAPSFQMIMERCAGVGDARRAELRWFVDLFGYEEMVRRARGTPRDPTWTLLAEQGFRAIQGLGGSVMLDEGAHDLIHHVCVHAPGGLDQAARMLSFVPLDEVSVPGWVPADAGDVTTFGWDLPLVLQGYGAWFDANFGEGDVGLFDEILAGIRDEKDGPRVDVRQELIDQLRGPIFAITVGRQGAGSGGGHLLLAARAGDAARVAEALRKMLEPDPEVRRELIKDHVTWVFRDLTSGERPSRNGADTSPLFTAADDDDPAEAALSNYAFSVADGYLFAATDVALIRQALDRGDAPSLSALGAYSEVREEIEKLRKGPMIACQFSQPSGGFGVTYEALRLGQASSGARLVHLLSELLFLVAPQPASSTQPSSTIDFGLLPEFSLIQHHLRPGGGWASRADDGWTLGGFVLKRGPEP